MSSDGIILEKKGKCDLNPYTVSEGERPSEGEKGGRSHSLRKVGDLV